MTESPSENETELIARSQQGDISAFNELVLLYQQTVYNVVLRLLGNRESAADVTQDTFIAALRGVGSFRPGSSFRAWLLRIASNQACDFWRRTHRHIHESLDSLTSETDPHSPNLLHTLIAGGSEINPEEHLLADELQKLIQAGLQTIPLDQRVAVILCDMQGLSYDEIAQTTSTTAGTVRSRIARGRKRLRDYLYQHRELLPRSYRLMTDSNESVF